MSDIYTRMTLNNIEQATRDAATVNEWRVLYGDERAAELIRERNRARAKRAYNERTVLLWIAIAFAALMTYVTH